MTNAKEIATYAIIIIIGLMVAQHMNVVVSGSMEPEFYRGDIVVVQQSSFLGLQEFDPSSTQIGDIVVYDAAWYDSPVIHRVINITQIDGKTYYTLKGDNNDQEDPYLVEEERILKRVVTIGDQPLIIPKIGYLTIWMKGY